MKKNGSLLTTLRQMTLVDDDEPDFFCSSASSCSTSGRNWENNLLQVCHPDFSGTFSEPDDLETPMELFRKLLTSNMLEMLVQQTNLYSTQTFGASVNTNISEVEQFLGIYLQIGLVQIANVRCYWERASRHSPIAYTMSRNRFLKLMACLHTVDNVLASEMKKTDKVWKLGPWILLLQRNLAKTEQEEYNAVDEMMVAFTGRSTLKQCMPNKPTPWGFKLWGRAGATGLLY